MQPLVSVIMSVFNGEKYVEDAIKSILGQTYRNWELIIVDDGSNDSTKEIIHQYTDDSRVKYFYHENIGLTKSLNRGIRESSGKYIARLDADDRSFPTRLEKQVAYLESNPSDVLIGSFYWNVDMREEFMFLACPPVDHEECIKLLKWSSSVFLHSSVMFRKVIGQETIIYDEKFKQGQDQRLWAKLSTFGKLSTLQEPLCLALRNSGESITSNRSILEGFLLKTRLAWFTRKDLRTSNIELILIVINLVKLYTKFYLKRFLMDIKVFSHLRRNISQKVFSVDACIIAEMWKYGVSRSL